MVEYAMFMTIKQQLLSKAYRKKLTIMVKNKVGDRWAAEEIVQDTLISAIDSLPMFKRKSSLFTWLGGIAKHEIADYYRKKKIKEVVFSKLPFLKELVSEALGPELKYQEMETKRKIRESLKKLSEGKSQILRLKYIEGLTMKQIAGKLNITVKAVESRLTRARLAFQQCYAEEASGQTSMVKPLG